MSSSQRSFTGTFSSPQENFQKSCLASLDKFYKSEIILRAERNTLKKIHFTDTACVMKSFKMPSFPQNYIYGLISNSKAKKSYFNAHQLIKKGFLTPAPVGYFEQRRGGKLTESFYLCAFQEAETLKTYLESTPAPSDSFIERLASLCLRLHQQGVNHRDFNPLNILIEGTDNDPAFSLVDINRISWSGPLTLDRSMKSMSRLYFPDGIEERLLTSYAALRKCDQQECKKLFREGKEKTARYFKNKKRLRKVFPKK